MLQPTLQIEHLRETLGIGTDRPRLSWKIETSSQNWQQAAFEIEYFDADGRLRNHTGRVESGQSVLVNWTFAPLHSRERVSLRVRVWGVDGSELYEAHLNGHVIGDHVLAPGWTVYDQRLRYQTST